VLSQDEGILLIYLFLINNGANMKKHLFFRDGEKKSLSKQHYIDISIILKNALDIGLYEQTQLLFES
jgi:hypothetical protein